MTQPQTATIINRLDQSIGVVTSEFARYIGPGNTDNEIPIDVAHEFKARKDVNVWIRKGKVRVLIPDEIETRPEVDSSPIEIEGFRALHYKTAIEKVNVITDLDLLERFFAADDRPRVVSALERRIKLLSEDRTEVVIDQVKKSAKG